MKNIKLVILAFAFVFATACKNDTKENTTESSDTEKPAPPPPTTVTSQKELAVTLSPKSDSKVEGTVTFKEKDGIVSMTANMTGLTEGEHAIHIHEKADCTSADGKSTGGHWNPTGQPHGKWKAEAGYHKGDIGNFKVATDGKGSVSMTTDEWCIGCGDTTKDILGKAIIVHQGTDDFTSQPSGAAGSRVSCGGIIE